MTARRIASAAILATLGLSALAQPVGVGGGGSFFSPSINPANTSEFYVSSDMSELFHTTDFGRSYDLVPFTQVQGGVYGVVRFTNNPAIRYAVSTIADVGTPVKSTDGGSTWALVPGNPDPSENTYSMYVQYDNPNRVLISYYGEIHISNDGGASFSSAHVAVSSGTGVVMGGVFFDGNTIYIGTNDGLLVSTNGGASFSVSPVGGIAANQVIWSFAGAKVGATTRLFCLTADPGDVYVGLFGGDYWDFMKGVYSLDYGAGSWVSRMNGLNVGSDFPMYVLMAENDIATAYLAGSNDQSAPTFFKTTNAGGTWTSVLQTTNNGNVVTGWCGDGGDRGWGYAEVAFGAAVARGDASRLLFTDYGFVHASTDGGASWRQAYLSAADEHPAGSSTPTNRSYHSIGAEDTTCWQIFWVDASNIWGAFSDIRGVRSTDGGSSWSFNYTGHTANSMYRIVRHANGALYAGTSAIHDMYQSTRLTDAILDNPDSDGKIIFSSNGGAAWQDLHVFGHPVFWVALDPTNGNRMYASVIHSTLGGVFVSNDIQNGAASTWTKLPDPPRTEGHPATIVVLNDGTVVATFSGRRDGSGFTPSSGCFVYSGGSWSDRSDAGMTYWTKDIVVYPYDAAQNTWYVGVFSGWGGPPNGLGGLYRTTNRGTSWTRVWNQDRVTSVTFSPSTAGEAYVTTETGGLWHSTSIDAPVPTMTLVTSYPFRQPERVFYNPFNPAQVWVSSFGNGMRILGQAGGPNIVTGPGPGPANAPNVRGFDTTGASNGATNFSAYASTGYGVNVATGNVRTTTPAADVVTGPGPGAIYGPQVRGFRQSGTALSKINFYAYGTLRFGVNVTTGDVDGDGYEEILSAAGPGAVFGPHVRSWNFDNGSIAPMAKISFFAFSTLRYGAQAAGASIDPDAYREILCAPGPSAAFGSQVRGFNYDNATVASISKVNFTPYTTMFGAHVTGGDLDQDGIEEIVTAPGPDPAATARIRGFDYDGVALAAIGGVDFDGMPGSNRMGATVDSLDIDGDGWAELVVGTGYDYVNGGPRVRGWNYDAATVTAITGLDFGAYAATQRQGVNVAVDVLAP